MECLGVDFWAKTFLCFVVFPMISITSQLRKLQEERELYDEFKGGTWATNAAVKRAVSGLGSFGSFGFDPGEVGRFLDVQWSGMLGCSVSHRAKPNPLSHRSVAWG